MTAFEVVRDRWRDPVLTTLLIVQCVTVFGLVPATAMNLSIPASVVGVLPLTFAAMVIITSRGRLSFIVGIVALLLSGVVAALEHSHGSRSVLILEDSIAAATFTLLSVVVFNAVYGPGHFTGHRVRGAIVLYLNIGLLFTLLYRLVATVSPGAFTHLESNEHTAALRAGLEYFSFTTLTSIGYGDILPVQPLARGLSMLESAIGQLFPATLLARAVTRAMHGEGE